MSETPKFGAAVVKVIRSVDVTATPPCPARTQTEEPSYSTA